MSMTCPKCNADNVQLLPVAFESGTAQAGTDTGGTEVDTGSTGAAAALGVPQRIAPPRKASYLGVLMGWVIISIVVSVILTLFHLPLLITNIFGLCLFCATGYSLTKAVAFNTREWPGLFRQWQRSYICMRCGNIFDGR